MKFSPALIALVIAVILQIVLAFVPLDDVELSIVKAMQVVSLLLTAYGAWDVYKPLLPGTPK